MFKTAGRAYSNRAPMSKNMNYIGLAAATVTVTTVAYILSKEPRKQQHSQIRTLPPVQQLIPLSTLDKLIHKNEYSIKPTPTVIRMDINSIFSNSPGEDFHSEHAFQNGSIVGIYDGHGGFECGELVAKYVSTYVGSYIKKPIESSHSKKDHIIKAMEKAFVQLDHDITQGCLPEFNKKTSWNPFKPMVDYNLILKGLKAAGAGSCALVAYIEDKDVFVASIGDCRAVMVFNFNKG
jgi:pyruvate dehydrogenase phosphatase